MSRILLLSLLAISLILTACGNTKKAETDDAAAVAKKEAQTKTTPKPQSKTTKTEGAVVGTDKGLEWKSLDGKESTLLVDGPIHWCQVDKGAKVTWFLAGKEKTHLGAFPFGAKQPGVLVENLPQLDTVLIQQGSGLLKPTPDGTAYDVAIQVDVKKGTAAKAIGCDGHMDTNCYVDPDAEKRELTPELVTKVKAIEGAKPDAEAIKKFAAMSGGTAKAGPKLQIKSDGCEECGNSMRVPGTEFLSVLVHEEMGDFYHGFHLLYDTKTKEFFHPHNPKKRVKDAKKLEGFEGAVLAASGGEAFAAFLKVVNKDGKLISDGAPVCGFAPK